MVDKENAVLLSEDVSPQDIAVLSFIQTQTAMQVCTEAFSVTLFELIQYQPLQDSNDEIIVIPSALDVCDKITKDLHKYGSGDIDDAEKMGLRNFLSELWKIDSVESLDNSVMEILKYVADPKLVTYDSENDFRDTKWSKFSPRSTIGHYIQRIVASLHLLHFDELFLLFEAFVSYREPTRELCTSLGGMDTSLLLPQNFPPKKKIKAKSDATDEKLYFSLKTKLDAALDTDISFPKDLTNEHKVNIFPICKHNIQALLNKQISLMETYGSRPPKKLKDIMTLMTSSSSDIYSVQNTNSSSIPSYYYIKYLECLQESDYQGSFQALHQYFDYMVSNNSRYFYHFALISRATLHQTFGEDEKALDAIEEAISVARENRDNSTLTYILSWLFNFMRNKPHLWDLQKFYHNNNESHLLDFLVKKSKSVSLSLYSMSYHFEALHIIDNRGAMNRYLESLYKATYVSIHDTIQCFIKAMEMSSVIWCRIGNSTLTDLYSNIVLDFTKVTGKQIDEVAIEIRRSYIDYLKGNPEEGYAALQQLKKRIVNDSSLTKSLTTRSLMMLIKININKRRFKVAEKTMELLNAEDIQDIELKTDLVYLNAQLQASIGNYSKAMNIISSYMSSTEEQVSQTKSNSYTIMRLNLLKCHIFNVSGNPTRALSLLIQQLEQAKRIGFVSVVIEGIVIFASILNNMASYVDAYSILSSKMVTILQVDNKEVSSSAFYELSRSCLNFIKQPQLRQRIGLDEKQVFNKFLRYLNTSITGFKQTVNLTMLQQCFKLEQEIALLQNSKDLVEHSQMSLLTLTKRTLEEANHNYIK